MACARSDPPPPPPPYLHLGADRAARATMNVYVQKQQQADCASRNELIDG